ncbi:MAG: PAS domain-containing protein, partial [Acidobacteriota bacterium]|nr:PAS domain-containing protein [Acidobacteriota bacterium]
IYGMSPEESAPGYEAFLARIHPEDRATVRQTIGDVERSGLHYQVEYRVIRSDGEVRWVSDRGQALVEPAGQRIGLVGVSWDITQSKIGEQEKVDSARELSRSNADLKRFAYVAPHDLKEPLRNVYAFSQLLAKQISSRLDIREIEMLDLITSGAKRMAELIDSLLAYSQVSSNRDTLLVQANAEDLLTQALKDLRLSIEQTHAEIEHGPLPTLRCSPLDVVQIFQNLIGNAIKYCDNAVPRIYISAENGGVNGCSGSVITELALIPATMIKSSECSNGSMGKSTQARA